MLKHVLLFSCLPLCACLVHTPLANIPMHTSEHLRIAWRPTYETAVLDAQKLGRPLLVVMGAGEKDGAVCLGADYLRSSALRDGRVVDKINAEFVPVWINVRTTPIPKFPFVRQVLVTATVDHANRVIDNFSRAFFFRSVIASPDGVRLLNPGAATVARAAAKLLFEGDWTYEANAPGDYLSMLEHALERFHRAPDAG